MGMVGGELDKITSEHVFRAARNGDQVSQEILERVSQAMGVGLVNILHLFNPDTIVIGGGVSQS
jgi:glucokinase